MKTVWFKSIFYAASFAACSMMAVLSGCASGGFKLTRQYAGWVNSQSTILRVVLYILTIPVYAVTMLVDMIYFNTMDFWEGRVSEGTYKFKDAEKTYVVKHEYMPGTRLRRSTIHINGSDEKRIQEIVLNETASGEIEMFIDGNVRARGRNLLSTPTVSVFDQKGKLLEDKTLWYDLPAHTRKSVAQSY